MVPSSRGNWVYTVRHLVTKAGQDVMEFYAQYSCQPLPATFSANQSGQAELCWERNPNHQSKGPPCTEREGTFRLGGHTFIHHGLASVTGFCIPVEMGCYTPERSKLSEYTKDSGVPPALSELVGLSKLQVDNSGW